jgi:hypothetical protein
MMAFGSFVIVFGFVLCMNEEANFINLIGLVIVFFGIWILSTNKTTKGE